MEVQSRLPLYRKEALFVSYVVPLQLRTANREVPGPGNNNSGILWLEIQQNVKYST